MRQWLSVIKSLDSDSAVNILALNDMMQILRRMLRSETPWIDVMDTLMRIKNRYFGRYAKMGSVANLDG